MFRKLAVWLVVLNVVDAVSTQLSISKGLAIEMNPVLALVLAHGFLLFWAVKFGVLLGALYMLWRIRKHWAEAVTAVMVGGTVLYALLALYQIGLWLVWLSR